MRKPTSNNVHELVGNRGLTRPVVKQRQLVDHLPRVFRGVFHGRPPGRELGCLAFGDSGVERVDHVEFLEVGKDFVFGDFVLAQAGYE